MKIYLIEFDNGCQYDDRENFTVGVFDSYEKAEEHCLKVGYIESETKGLFIPKNAKWYNNKTLSIEEYEMNVAFNEVNYD